MYNELLLSTGGGIISKSSVSPQMGSACVMIGIGGTGLAALRRVKREVYTHLEPDDPNADIPRYSKIAFLGIDTDTDDLTEENKDSSDLQADEQWSVNIPNLDMILNDDVTLRDPFMKWLSKGIKLQGDKGAGGVRQAGRFCLFKRAPALRAKLSSLIVNVMAEAKQPSVQIHIFAGISGGTGSGCFLDVCYIIRSILDSKKINSTICGYFFLPDTQLLRPGIQGNQGIEAYNMRNGYAAIRDLDYCMSIPASSGCFQENYAPGMSIFSRQAPVDLCHLISATDTNGVIKNDGFLYGLSVVAEYVLTYLADVNATAAQKKNDSLGLTIEGFTINVRTALSMLNPTVGAERNYSILGSSSAELPLSHIGTYLAARTYEKMRPSMERHSSKASCIEFARSVGCTTGGLIKALSSGVSSYINFNTDLEKVDHLNETMDAWDKVPSSLYAPINACRTKAMGVIQANYTAQSKNLDSYDASRNAQVINPTFVLRMFNELILVCKDPNRGPTMAAELLHGDGIHDLRDELDGILTDVDEKAHSFEANEPLRRQDILRAAHNYNKAVVGWKRKLTAYQDAWTEYLKLEINLELCKKLKALIPQLKRHIDTMYHNYFSPMSDMVFELAQTFDANLRWLESPAHTARESFSWRIFEYDAVKDDLEENVLKQQTVSVEFTDFLSHLMNYYREWNNRVPYRVAHCVNNYMVTRFKNTLSKTVDQFLCIAYNEPNPANLPTKIQTQLLNRVETHASPLFWKSPTFTLDATTTAEHSILSIPMGSTAVANAANNFTVNNPTCLVRQSRLCDRILCLRFVSGIPLYAYQGIASLKGPYDNDNGVGLHLHERDENWRVMLPLPVPYSVQVMNGTNAAREDELSALYDTAVQERIISPESPLFPDQYVVRILQNTEAVVSKYQKELYFYAGKLNQADLLRAIDELRIKRAELLPDTVPDGEGLPLLNDGARNNDNPALDAREKVRKDYFIRFLPLSRAAKDSLAQLRRIDEKLAEMESWMNDQSDFEKRVKRYIMLDEMGYLHRESDMKIQLQFTYRSVPQQFQMCDVDSAYRFAPEYQTFLQLNGLVPRLLTSLDEELERRYKEMKYEWKSALEKILSNSGEEKIGSVQTRYLNDPNCEAIPAFYRHLHELALEELEALERSALETEKPSGWKCEVCSSENAQEDSFCFECGAPKPQPRKTWICKNGHTVLWEKKFCGKCGDRRPEPTVDWVCPVCKEKNSAENQWCDNCGTKRNL